MKIVELTPDDAEKVCRDISADLPEWFGIPEANERYANGVKERQTFGYFNEECLGMISIEFPFEKSANIYWMGIKRAFHNKGIEKVLLQHAEKVCIERGVFSISVETLSPGENDSNSLKTYAFYKTEGFRPLFELDTYGPDFKIVYMNKVISPKIFDWIDLTHAITEEIPTWSGDCGFKHIDMVTYDECTTECKFLIQKIETIAGIGTHIDAPAHCYKGGKFVGDLSLDFLISPCLVVDVSDEVHADYMISLDDINRFEKEHGKLWKNTLVIFRTGWDQYWNEPKKYHNDYHFPSIDKEVAEYLVGAGIIGIGIDTLSPDRPESGYPVHQIVLGANKYIVENVANSHRLPAVGGYAFVLPLRVAKGTESPIRLLGMIQTT